MNGRTVTVVRSAAASGAVVARKRTASAVARTGMRGPPSEVPVIPRPEPCSTASVSYIGRAQGRCTLATSHTGCATECGSHTAQDEQDRREDRRAADHVAGDLTGLL